MRPKRKLQQQDVGTTGSPITRISQFIEFYFDYDDRYGNIYDIYSDYLLTQDSILLARLPKFFSEFLNMEEDDTKFEEFLDTMLKLLGKDYTDEPVYKGANVLTLMCCAIFHLCKMHHMMNMNTGFNYTTETLYLPAFNKWLGRFLETYDSITMNQYIDGFFTPFTYLTLTFFVARDMEFEETPYYTFFNVIQYNKDTMNFKIDVLEEMCKPFCEDVYVDIYNFDTKSIYVIEDDRKYIDKTMIINYKYYKEEELYGSIFNYEAIYHFSQDTDAVYEYVNPASRSDFITLLYLNYEIPLFLYDVDDDENIIYNEKWLVILRLMWKYLEASHNLEIDIKTMLGFLITQSVHTHKFVANANSYKLFIRNDINESVLFPLIRNTNGGYDSKEYTKILFQAMFKNNYKYFDKFESVDYRNGIKFSEYMKVFANRHMLNVFNNDGDDVLLHILKTAFEADKPSPKNVKDSVSLTSPWFTLGEDTVSFKNHSYQMFDSIEILRVIYSDTIKALLKYNIKLINSDAFDKQAAKVYKRQLFAFKEILLKIGVNLDKYPINKLVVASPPTIKSKRSLDKKVDEPLRTNMFSNFYDKGLLNRLSKIYVRTVADDTNNSQHINNYDRIPKIRRYLIKKYKHNIDYSGDYYLDPRNHRITATTGNELEALYQYWQTKLNKGNLNVPYIITFHQSAGIDMYGLTKQFFDKAGEQLRIKYFDLLPNSKRYILGPNVTVDEAYFIGQILAMLILHNSTITFNISHILLGYLMFREEDIKTEELFLYYLLDLNLENSKMYMESCAADPNSTLGIACDPEAILDSTIKPRYNFDTDAVKAFVRGFFINSKNHKLFYSTFSTIGDKIRMYDLDKLLSVYSLSNEEYKKYIFDKVNVVYNNNVIDKKSNNKELKEVCKVYHWLEELFVNDTDQSLKALYDKFDNELINNDAALIAKKETFLSKKAFCSSILVFWTSVKGIIVDNDYNIRLDDTRGADIHSHTCSNLLVLPVGGHINSKQALYNALLSICIWNIKDAFDMV